MVYVKVKYNNDWYFVIPTFCTDDFGFKLVFKFYNDDGTEFDLTGYDVNFYAKYLNDYNQYLISSTLLAEDLSNGEVYYDVIQNSFNTTGSYKVFFIISKTGYRKQVEFNRLNIIPGKSDNITVTPTTTTDDIPEGSINLYWDYNADNNKIINVATPTDDNDAATKAYVDNNSSNSPLTTKGDIFVYSDDNDRLPVGTDGKVLTADSSSPTGLSWTDKGGAGNVYVDIISEGAIPTTATTITFTETYRKLVIRAWLTSGFTFRVEINGLQLYKWLYTSTSITSTNTTMGNVVASYLEVGNQGTSSNPAVSVAEFTIIGDRIQFIANYNKTTTTYTKFIKEGTLIDNNTFNSITLNSGSDGSLVGYYILEAYK